MEKLPSEVLNYSRGTPPAGPKVMLYTIFTSFSSWFQPCDYWNDSKAENRGQPVLHCNQNPGHLVILHGQFLILWSPISKILDQKLDLVGLNPSEPLLVHPSMCYHSLLCFWGPRGLIIVEFPKDNFTLYKEVGFIYSILTYCPHHHSQISLEMCWYNIL